MRAIDFDNDKLLDMSMALRMSQSDTIIFTYTFTFSDGKQASFDVRLNSATGTSRNPWPQKLPDWTKLAHHQCAHCPLSAKEHDYCPAAVSVVDIVDFFHEVSSIEPVEVSVYSEARTTVKDRVPLPNAIGAVMGARFASSGCPITAMFQPMVRYHVPFTTMDEATYRIVTMHALVQFLRMSDGQSVDWSFDGLSQLCRDVNRLNLDFSRRLRELQVNDATTNAITSLDSFVQMVDITVDDDFLTELKELFRAHL